MTNVKSLEIARFFKEQESSFSAMRQIAEETIANILSLDLTRGFNGRQLRQMRDNLYISQRILIITSPETRKRIGQKYKELGRDELTTEEIEECLEPTRAIRFSIAITPIRKTR